MTASTPPPPPPPPSSAAPPPSVSGGGGSRRWVVPVAVVAAVAIAVGVIGFVVVGGDEAGAEVTLEASTDPGPDPFSESMAVVEVAEFPGEVEAVITSARAELPRDDATLRASGTEPGLYGGTQDETVCDADRLITFLEDNPDKAAAWGDAAGIARDDIAEFIGSLTSVVLTVDTRVTNHGFADGQATPRQSVLQAGTAVMVDDRGVPRVKCGCGNPLLEPTGDADLAGADGAWAGYDPSQVAVIDPGDTTDTLTLVDIDTGDTYQQTVGSTKLVLAPDGLGVVTFGEPMDEVVATLTELLGPPDEDDIDPGTGNFRYVRWSGLQIGDSGVGRHTPAAEAERFRDYFFESAEFRGATREGISIGSTVPEVFEAYPELYSGHGGCQVATPEDTVLRTPESLIFRIQDGAVSLINGSAQGERCG